MDKIKQFIAKIKEKAERAKNYLREEFSRSNSINFPQDKQPLNYQIEGKKALAAESIPYLNIFFYLLLFLLILAILWAKFSVIEEVTVGSGKVIPSSHVKSIQSLDGGVLTELLVKQGQIVKENQIVARLTVSDFQADFLSTKNHYMTLLATRARLQAEASQKPNIQFPPEIANSKEITTNEINLFKSRRQSLDERVATLRKSLEISNKQLKILQPLADKGIVSKLEVLQLQNNINTIKGNISDETNKFNKEVLTDLNKADDEIKTLHEKMIGLQDRINRAIIRSPVYGVVKQINVTTIGGILKPGAELMQIVPLADTLLVETRILPKDIAFIHPGQKARVKFTAYDYSIYGGLDGTVEYISADTVVDEKGDMYYLVLIRTNRSYLGTKQKPLPLIPGMVTTVDILTGKKSILNYLLKPILRAKQEALRER